MPLFLACAPNLLLNKARQRCLFFISAGARSSVPVPGSRGLASVSLLDPASSLRLLSELLLRALLTPPEFAPALWLTLRFLRVLSAPRKKALAERIRRQLRWLESRSADPAGF